MLHCSKRVTVLKNDILRPTSHGKTRVEAKLKQFTGTFEVVFLSALPSQGGEYIAAMHKQVVHRQFPEPSNYGSFANGETGEGWKR